MFDKLNYSKQRQFETTQIPPYNTAIMNTFFCLNRKKLHENIASVQTERSSLKGKVGVNVAPPTTIVPFIEFR